MAPRRNVLSSPDSSPSADHSLDSFTKGYVRKRAGQLAGKHGFRLADRDEIEQRLYLKLAASLHLADPNSPQWKAFVAKTVNRHIASMIRDARAEKRDHRRTSSIHDVIGAEDGALIEIADTVGEDDTLRRRTQEQRAGQELTELQIDLAACISELTDGRQREFCERLKHDSIAQVARDMDIPRTTLNAWLVKLRSRFGELGLANYFERGSSVCGSTGLLSK